ncbi:4-alpha-glucanotransferase [Burkholderia sp. Bp8963]|uniref:4-alpha-glucanotransferase n=1 Tax=Burkholderia sp. Bp8963 TaxID=2184547 RepID=UPI000F59E13C|nr:4-alpha-glucanotransferase [Burkholderia sp. Bp8963]RQS71240.1 4-alpha-glucanotransferase [Burkholderia sp. Bp8963]
MTTDIPIATLARAAGFEIEWTDAAGVARRVDDGVLYALVATLGWPCGTAAERVDSANALAAAAATPPHFVTGDAGVPLVLPLTVMRPGERFRIALETGATVNGHVAGAGDRGALPPLAAGYHTLEIGERQITLAIAPPPGRTFADAARERDADGCWGIAAQLYGLRRAHDDGCGDFTALAQLAAHAARHGAQALAISPTHALFPAQPERDSPYSPSSRRWHNVAYLACDAVPGAERVPADGDSLADAPLIDWPRVLPRKLHALRVRFDAWRAHGGAGHEAFQRFRAEGGAALDAHARFDALHAYCIGHGFGADWRHWPARWQMPASAEVDAFAREHEDTVAFHAFLQWCATNALADAQRAARAAGMAIGLIADLAVGSDHAGSDVWAHRATLLHGASLGAPPDLFNADGQAWGVTTWTPAALRAEGFASFVDLLRATFAHAGGIRIDHVLGFARMWIVPDGARPRDGAYLRYPCDDLLRLVALESARHHAIAIGEDLGTVPAGFRARLAAHGIAGMRVLWFERDADGAFLPPRAWDCDAVAMTSTHDLPTVAGWWRGSDLGWRRAVARGCEDRDGGGTGRDGGAEAEAEAEAKAKAEADFASDAGRDVRAGRPPEADARAVAARDTERAALWHALQRAGCAPAGRDLAPPDAPPVDAILAYVAQGPSPLAMLPLEDLLALDAQPNLPGPPCGHPNWRRRLARPVDALFDTDVCARIATVAQARCTRERTQ